MSTKEEREAARAARLAKSDALIAEKREEEEEILFKLEEEHNWVLGRDIAATFCHNTGKIVVVKKPSPVVHKTFIKKLHKNGVNDDDNYEILLACLVYPDKSELEKVIIETPAIISMASDQCCQLAGFSKQALEGK